jgi:predicted nucleic acid-binding protein
MPPSPPKPAESRTPLLLDTTVLNNFLKVGRLPRLSRLFPASLRIAAQVYDELKAGGLESPIRDGVAEGWLRLVTPESGRETTLYSEYSRSLGPGEAASLAIAICRGWSLATDDRAARRAARAAGVAITGSVGILLSAVQAGVITRHEGNQLLQEMRRLGYRFPIDTLDGLP